MASLKLLIISGEASGDLHGALLAENIFKLAPSIRIFGVGGYKMKTAGVEIFFDIKDLAVIGITEVFGKYRILKDLLDKIREKLKSDPPTAVILIDYPGFNLRVAEIAHNLKIPVIYYICPQIWAWAPSRINKIAAWVDKAIVIFKFEMELYQKASVPVEFVGHPLLDTIQSETDKETALQYFGLNDAKRIITLMPGSRLSEIKNHMPILLKTAKFIMDRLPQTKFIIPCAPEIEMEILGKYIRNAKMPIRIIKGKNYDVINVSDFVIVASGTATLEVAYFEKPMIIIYQTSFINWILGKMFMIIPYFGLVNILAGEEIVPEYLQFEVDPETMAEYVFSILKDKEKYIYIQNKLREVKNKMGTSGASKKAAEVILKQISK
ncbi:MAG: lipid-A-disaccharide synthase [Candidatus Firestonebacteria bacterium]|nr:lipid-A-disaccharide synthase [Candidatus Firestonebacteria bacterium]